MGQPAYQNGETVVYQIGETKIFFVSPKSEFKKTDKDNGGLNHIAFGVRNLDELKAFGNLLNEAAVKHSGIKIDHYGNKEFMWFDDPAGASVEIYCRPF